MRQQLRFTIGGYFGFGNLGDEAILASMIADFRKEFSGATFEILCADLPTVSGTDITTVRWKNWPQVVESVRGCDCLIVGGGGIFTYHMQYLEQDFLRQSDSLAAMIFGLPALAYLLGKPAFIYAIGASDFESTTALEHAQMAARLANSCTVRDERSRRILGDGLQLQRIPIHADPAFRLVNERLPAAELEAAGIGADEPVVGVVARNWGTASDAACWEALVGDALREFAIRHSTRLLFIPFHALPDLEDNQNYDPAVVRRLRDAVGRGRTAELPHGLRPGQVSAVLGNCRMVVTMRLHGAILSVRNATPFVALNYDPKVASVLCERNLGQFVLAVPRDSWGARRFAQLLEEVWTSQVSIRELLRKAALAAEEDARGHVDQLRRAVISGGAMPTSVDAKTSRFLIQTAALQTLRLTEAEAQATLAGAEVQRLRTGIRRLVDSGSLEAALLMLREWAPKRKEALAEWHYLLAFCLHGLRRETEVAKSHYDAALAMGFDEFWTRYQRGQLLLRRGDREAARGDLTRACALKPEHEGATRLLRKVRA